MKIIIDNKIPNITIDSKNSNDINEVKKTLITALELDGFKKEQIEEIFKTSNKKKYDCVWDFNNGFACVKLSDKWGHINEKGEEITPIKYDNTSYFENGFAPVRLSDKWGVINTEGKEVITCKHTLNEIEPLIENLRKNGESKKKYDYVYSTHNGIVTVVTFKM